MKSLQEIIDGAKRLVFFGGAGVSTEIASLVRTKFNYFHPSTIALTSAVFAAMLLWMDSHAVSMPSA